MRYLLQWISLRRFLQEKRTGLTLLGVALGIAVFISIRIANTSVLSAYRGSIDAIAGQTTLEVTSAVGALDETILPEIRGTAGVLYAAPVIQHALPVVVPPQAEGEILLMMGIDLLQEGPFRAYALNDSPDEEAFRTLLDPSAFLLTEKFAARHQIKLGQTISVRMGAELLSFRAAGFLKPKGPAAAQDGNIAILDIAAAQWRLGKLGKLDRVDLITDEAIPLETTIKGLKAALGESAIIRRPAQRGAQVEKMLGAFQMNLTALSAISLFVGIFLIYNTLLVSVAHRRKEIGILRALGVARSQIFLLFTLEGITIGIAGGVLGVLAGAFIARSVLQLIARTVRSLYVSIPPSPFSLPSSTFFEGIGVGIVVATLSSFFPALQAGLLKPKEAMEGIYSSQRPVNHWTFLIAGIALGAISFLLSRLPELSNLHQSNFSLIKSFAGYLSAATLLVAFSLLVPSSILLFSFLTRPFLRRLSPEWRLAEGHLHQALHRNGATVAAFMAALAMMISVVIMIESFRDTITLWIDQTIRADLIAAPASLLSKESEETLPESLLKEVSAVSGVEAVDGYRSMQLQFRNEPAVLVGRNLSVHATHSSFMFRSGDSKEIIERTIRERKLLISEVFANRFHLREGDSVTLPSPKGAVPFQVAGIFYEYATDGGKMVIDRALLKEIWNEDQINVIGVYLTKGASPETVHREIVQALGGRFGLTVVTQVSFKNEIIKIFDQTFLITYALEWIAMVVALIGIANTLFVSVLERRREIGILRAIGASDRQVTQVVIIEALYMGWVGYLLSVFCALFLSLLLIFVINKQSFGWTLLFHFPPKILLHAFLLATGASLIAGYFPARQATKMEVTEAIAYE